MEYFMDYSNNILFLNSIIEYFWTFNIQSRVVCSISNSFIYSSLYRWYKDSNITNVAKRALFYFNLGFLFVDIENILFIPEIRWLFHRNDLIVAHAHVAMGIGVFLWL